jgi:hypothetical protein
MSASNERRQFSPLPLGSGVWVSFFPFPLPEARIRYVPAWFERLHGMTASEVREVLKEEWSEIGVPSLRAFAESLLTLHLTGVLKLERKVGSHNAWLVMSHYRPCEAVFDAVLNLRGTDAIYLPAPFRGPTDTLPPAFDRDDLIRSFFHRFGGLRDSPPSYEGAFVEFPYILERFLPEEPNPWVDTVWEDALTLYVNDTGDEIVLNKVGDVGWFPHDSLEDVMPRP